MSDETIKDIFVTIAYKAMECGKEIRLEKGKNKSESNILSGAFSKGINEYDSLSLLVYTSGNMDDEVEVSEDNGEECEDVEYNRMRGSK